MPADQWDDVGGSNRPGLVRTVLVEEIGSSLMACGGAADDTTTDSIDPTGREWVLEELNGVADLADDRAFRTTQAVSLAVFATPDRIRTHRLANRLPASVTVSDRFRVVPLVRAVTLPHAAWVLALASALRYQP